MYCIYMLTKASLKMFLRNRQALFFSIFMPLLIMLIFGAMNFGKEAPLVIGLVSRKAGPASQEFSKHLKEIPSLNLREGSLDEELNELKEGNRSVVLVVPDDFLISDSSHELTAYVNEGRPIEANMAMILIDRMADKATLAASQIKPLFTIKQQSVSEHSVRYIEFLLPGIIAMSVMQMSVFSVAFVFAQYREKGVLKRLLATPVRPYQFVTANIVTRLIMSLVQACLFTALGLAIFHVRVAGAYWILGVAIVLGSLMFLGLGFTISGLCKTMETVPVLSNIIVFPMLFLGNVFFPASNVPKWLQPVANNLPLTYFARALRAVMTQGSGLAAVKWDLLGVLGWGVLLITLAMLTFRMQEKDV